MKFLDILKPEQNNEETSNSASTMQEKSIDHDTISEKAPRFKSRNKPTVDSYSSQETIIKAPEEASIFVNNSQKVKICKPKSYAAVTSIGQAIKDRKIVILHLEELDPSVATCILEFVYGICYAFDIEPENVDDKIIMIDPEHTNNVSRSRR